MLTKEDYMRLPKERLAELLVQATSPVLHIPPTVSIPSIRIVDGCPYGGKCTNPFKDCIGCPCYSATFDSTSYQSTSTINKEDDGNKENK